MAKRLTIFEFSAKRGLRSNNQQCVVICSGKNINLELRFSEICASFTFSQDSCCLSTPVHQTGHNFTVEVDVSNADNGLLYLAQRKLTGTITVDSALPDKSGRYELEGYVTQPDFYIVYRQPQRYINLVIHPGDHFRVITDATPSITITWLKVRKIPG